MKALRLVDKLHQICVVLGEPSYYDVTKVYSTKGVLTGSIKVSGYSSKVRVKQSTMGVWYVI